jgi:mono/diheme cytochrome c family protein
MQAPKNGFFYVLDRESGKLISAEPYVPANWATHVDIETGRPVEVAGARYVKNYKVIFPNSWGGHNWHPMSYSPLTGLVYIPVIGGPEAFSNWKDFEYFENHVNTGTDSEISTSVSAVELDEYPLLTIRVSAWDPVKRQEVFRIGSQSGWNAGVLSTAGNLIFQGDSSGEFAAYSADSGDHLWSAKINTGIMAPPITFSVDGEQYVSVVGGWGINIGSFDGDADVRTDVDAVGRVATFKLGGTATIPRPSAIVKVVGELPKIDAGEEAIAKGYALYTERCSWCHGPNAIGSGAVPDLRYSTLQTHEIFKPSVLEGAYVSRGMPSFAGVLTDADVERIQAYLVTQSAALRERDSH